MVKKIKLLRNLIFEKSRNTAQDIAILQVPGEVNDALALPIKNLEFSLESMPPAVDWEAVNQTDSPEPSALFTNPAGQRYPCWLPGDENLGGDWLLSHNYYPFYYRLYKSLCAGRKNPALLEFGVRSGYSAVVFAKAVEGPKTYIGVDPNLYVVEGLEKAAHTFRLIREEGNPFTSFLLEGFSSSTAVQKTLSYSGPFDLVHIDGEHTYFGKLLDLWIARQQVAKDGYILVDDLEHHGMIRDSIKAACYLGWFSAFSFVPTRQGLGVLKP